MAIPPWQAVDPPADPERTLLETSGDVGAELNHGSRVEPRELNKFPVNFVRTFRMKPNIIQSS
jgi:hypothetical protein